MIAGVTLCKAEQLKKLHPNKTWTCVTDPTKLRHVLAHTEIQYLTENEYFDVDNYTADPIRSKLQTKLLYLTGT